MAGKEKTALVVEGGGMRGIFSAGVLDEFMARRFDPFDLYIGVSVGACNLSSHVAGQYQRNYRLITGLMLETEMFSWSKFFRGGNYMDLDWFWDRCDLEDPLDVAAAEKNSKGKEFIVVCTTVDSGEPLYFEPVKSNWSHAIKASCALPVLYRTPIRIDDRLVIDGGVADAIPVREAYGRGARRIIVIRSQPSNYKKKDSVESWLISLFFRKNPELLRTIRIKSSFYNESVRFINHPPEDVKIWEIAPPGPLLTSRTSQCREALETDYHLGRSMAKRFLGKYGGDAGPYTSGSR